MWSLFLSGCWKTPPTSLGRQAQRWQITVVIADGERVLSAAYTLETEPAGEQRWSVSTKHTEGTWEEGARIHSFNSESPSTSDPWPLSAQHLISSVPVIVQLSEEGSPETIVDPEGWREAAQRVLYGSELPHEALATSQALLDPQGVLFDLRRTFPGLPSTRDWSRPERISGVIAERTEHCDASPSPPQWSCSGTIQAPGGGAIWLHEVESWTRISHDQRGLVEIESGYSGTRFTNPGPGLSPTDTPIACRRLVQRR